MAMQHLPVPYPASSKHAQQPGLQLSMGRGDSALPRQPGQAGFSQPLEATQHTVPEPPVRLEHRCADPATLEQDLTMAMHQEHDFCVYVDWDRITDRSTWTILHLHMTCCQQHRNQQ